MESPARAVIDTSGEFPSTTPPEAAHVRFSVPIGRVRALVAGAHLERLHHDLSQRGID